MQSNTSSRRRFTDAARAAALVARQRKRENAPPLNTPEVFAVRSDEAHGQFQWEARRFGGVVVGRSACSYATPDAAQSAGIEVLSRRESPHDL